MMLHLVAHVVNVTDNPQIEFEVASQSANGDWFTNDGRIIWPFHFERLPQYLDNVAIPEGWIDHLHQLADEYAANNRTPAAPKMNELLDIILGARPTPTLASPTRR